MDRGPREIEVYVNGRLISASEPAISALDSGFNFGDGVFEGLRVYSGRVFRLDDHIRRLFQSAAAVDISIGMSKTAVADEILGWLRVNNVSDQFHFRPIVTRGERRPPRVDPRFASSGANVVFVGAEIVQSDMGVRLVVSSVRRTPADSLDPKVKSLSYLNNILARLEAIRSGVDDCLVLDHAGFLAEASASNVFLVRDDQLQTPFARACLAGITRDTVMKLAKHIGLYAVEKDLTVTDALSADEFFLTGTATEVTPVIQLNGRAIGDGDTFPVTSRLAAMYHSLVLSEGADIRSADVRVP